MTTFQHFVGVILFWSALIAFPCAFVWWVFSLRDWPDADEADHD